MKLSIYTAIKNGIYFDFHIVEMLKHHLPLADEIIVNEGYSSDKTYEKIKNIDPKIKIFRTKWGKPNSNKWYIKFKDFARKKCTGDWCILLDADEFIPELEFEKIRGYLSKTKKQIIPLKFINFYGNYKVKIKDPRKFNHPYMPYRIHRNYENIEILGDGAEVFFKNQMPKNPKDKSKISKKYFMCHHFGTVRHSGRLRHKWRVQGRLHGKRGKKFDLDKLDKKTINFFNKNPHDWNDPDFIDDLEIYSGPYIKAIRDNPKEFVRDNFYLFKKLSK